VAPFEQTTTAVAGLSGTSANMKYVLTWHSTKEFLNFRMLTRDLHQEAKGIWQMIRVKSAKAG